MFVFRIRIAKQRFCSRVSLLYLSENVGYFDFSAFRFGFDFRFSEVCEVLFHRDTIFAKDGFQTLVDVRNGEAASVRISLFQSFVILLGIFFLFPRCLILHFSKYSVLYYSPTAIELLRNACELLVISDINLTQIIAAH